jgi:hypothetical protein
MAEWNDQNGETLQNFNTAAEGWDTAVANSDLADLGQECQRLSSSIQAVQSLPAVPDAEAQTQIQSGVQAAQTGYQMGCSGATDSGILTQASTYLTQASDDFTAAAGRINDIIESGS